MRLNEVSYSDTQPIEGYGAGYYRIGGEAHEAPLVLLPSGISKWGGYEDLEVLLANAETIDILLIGTGPEISHVPAPLRDTLEGAGIGLEVMAPAQACRTYNVLLGEGRRIGLAVLPV